MRHTIECHSLDDVYNLDETGVFWRQVPQRTLATGKRAGRKKYIQRATASMKCSATGTGKQELFVIGKVKCPRCFPRAFQPELDWRIR